MAESKRAQYWFPAKRYGWGWGLPSQWQGWVAYLLYAALLIAGLVIIGPNRNAVGFLIYTAAISALLFAVCWFKGERPSWRWGRSDA